MWHRRPKLDRGRESFYPAIVPKVDRALLLASFNPPDRLRGESCPTYMLIFFLGVLFLRGILLYRVKVVRLVIGALRFPTHWLAPFLSGGCCRSFLLHSVLRVGLSSSFWLGDIPPSVQQLACWSGVGIGLVLGLCAGPLPVTAWQSVKRGRAGRSLQ